MAHVEGKADEEQQKRDVKEHGEDRHDQVDLIVLQADAPVMPNEGASLRRSGDVALVLLNNISA